MDRPILDSLGRIPVSRSGTLRAYRIQHCSAMDSPYYSLNHDAFGARDRGPNRLYVDSRYLDRTTYSNRWADDDGGSYARDSTRKIEIREGIGFLTVPSCGKHVKVPDSTYQ